jgi:hypothetical protein
MVIFFYRPNQTNPRLCFQDAELPSLCLVSKLFLPECRFLAYPYLISVPIFNEPKRIPFIPHLDHALYLKITGIINLEIIIIESFNALPSELRHKMKHVRVKTHCEEEALWLFRRQRMFYSIATVVARLNAPLLESFTVVGMNQHKLKRLRILNRLDFVTASSKGDGRVVTVDWACEQELKN